VSVWEIEGGKLVLGKVEGSIGRRKRNHAMAENIMSIMAPDGRKTYII